MAADKRRGLRLRCDFLLAVEGEDEAFCRRRGDLSETGIYFERESPIGKVGTVQWLRVGSVDGAETVEVMGRIIRVVSLDDIWRETTAYGVALEFMPESRTKIQAVARLVRRVDQACGVEASAIAPPNTIRRMVLETSWSVNLGEEVRLELPGVGRAMRFSGKVVDVRPGAEGYCAAEVKLQLRLPGGKRVGSESIAEAVDLLLDDLSAPTEQGSRREHLVGTLSRIRVPSLLCLFEMERMSGELRLHQGGEHGRIYLRDGQVVDVGITDKSLSPHGAASQLISWSHGKFEFIMRQVNRPDRVSTTTTGLLLDLAREQDEARR